MRSKSPLCLESHNRILAVFVLGTRYRVAHRPCSRKDDLQNWSKKEVSFVLFEEMAVFCSSSLVRVVMCKYVRVRT